MSQSHAPGEPTAPEAPAESGGVKLRERYGLILALLLLAYVATAVEHTLLSTIFNALVWGLVLLAALWSPGLPRTLRRVGLGTTLILLISAVWLGAFESTRSLGWWAIALALAQFAALLAILSRISKHQRVTFQTVMGGVAAYALIAFAMAALYLGLDRLTGPGFIDGVANDGDYTYFSFVTLTTVGFGDITPASELAKRLVVVEAFVGQVFLITLVARLVSLWGKPLKYASE